MPPKKRGQANNTPSPPDSAPDPAKKPSKQRVTSALRPLAPKMRQQDPPASDQSTTFDVYNYATHPTSYTQGVQTGVLSGTWPDHDTQRLQAGGSLGAWPEYEHLHPTPTSTGRSTLGASTQQPSSASPTSAYDRDAPPRQPRHTDWRPISPLHAPGSSRGGQPAPPASLHAAGETAKDPRRPRHKQRPTAPPLDLHADEEKAEDSPIATQSQSKTPKKESEDEVLIRLITKYSHRSGHNTKTNWEKVSQGMKAHPFEHPFDYSIDWCQERWKEKLDPNADRPWKPDEDAKLKELKGDSTDFDWEVIASAMANKGFYRQPASFRKRWQDVLRGKPPAKRRFLNEEKETLLVLRGSGHSFREIADEFERRGWHRDHATLNDLHTKLT